MGFEIVAEQRNTRHGTERRDYTRNRVGGGNFRTHNGFGGRHRGYMRQHYGERGDGVMGCLCLSFIVGLVLMAMGANKLAASAVDTRGNMIKGATTAINSWTSTTGPRFTGAFPYKFGATTSEELTSTTVAKTASIFGEPASTLPGWNSYSMKLSTAMKDTPIPPTSSAPTPYTMNTAAVDIKSATTGLSTVGGDFKLALYKESVSQWGCQVDTSGEGIGGTICDSGKTCGLNVRADGCPNNQPTWSYGGSTQWVKDQVNGVTKCLDYATCFCVCTAGRNSGRRIPTSYYPPSYNAWSGYFYQNKANCLDLSRAYCGTPSKAAMLCNTEPVKRTTCASQCNNENGVYVVDPTSVLPAQTWGGGVYGKAKCTVTKKLQLNEVCLMTSASSSSRSAVTAVAADGLPGCKWDGTKLVSTVYGSAGASRPSKTSGFTLTVMSPDDPTFAAGKLTDPPYCDLRSSPDKCFGPTQAENLAMGLGLLIPGLVLLFGPCAAVFWVSQKMRPKLPPATMMQPPVVATATAMPVAMATATAVPMQQTYV